MLIVSVTSWLKTYRICPLICQLLLEPHWVSNPQDLSPHMPVATGATLCFKPIGCPSYAPCYWGTLSSKPIGFVPSYACCCWSHEFQTHRICPLICSLLELSFKPRHSWCAVSPDLVMSSSQCSYMVFFVYRIVPFTDLQIQQIHSLLVWHSSVTWTMCPYKTLSVGTPYAWWPFMPNAQLWTWHKTESQSLWFFHDFSSDTCAWKPSGLKGIADTSSLIIDQQSPLFSVLTFPFILT